MPLIKLSAGTASVLGLKPIKLLTPPTTAYFLVGERCSFACSFCSHSQKAQTDLRFLSRLSWPSFSLPEVLKGLKNNKDRFARICLQVVNSPGAKEDALKLCASFKQEIGLPLSLSINPQPGLAARAKAAGVDRLCFPLDCSSDSLFKQHRTGNRKLIRNALLSARKFFPGKVITHLIAGLGETEAEMVREIRSIYRNGIKVALFAFTPVRNTPLAGQQPPDLAYYRRIQFFHYLIKKGLKIRVKGNKAYWEGKTPFSQNSFKIEELFLTTGCPGCNRPFYNEKPGGTIYNFPEKISGKALEQELQYLKGEMACI